MLKETRNYDYAVFKLLIYNECVQREKKIERKKFSAKIERTRLAINLN
jgi:hypothetical protein